MLSFWRKKSKKWLFEIFDFSKSFEKKISSKKINIFGVFLLFMFLSYLMYYLIKWHRETPTVPPVGAVNVPAENPKIQKIHIFEDFWGHFFLINHIGFSLKYVIPKSSTDFFSSKKKFSTKFFIFSFFIISHAQPMQVTSRNSPWARRTGRYEKKCPFSPLNPVWGPSTSWILCVLSVATTQHTY